MGAISTDAHRICHGRVAVSSSPGADFSIGRYGIAALWQSIPTEVSIADDSLSQYELSDTDGTIELGSPQYSSEAAKEVATVVAVLNMLKLADVLSPQPRPSADRDDCADVAVVWVVPLTTAAHAGWVRIRMQTRVRTAHARPTWRKRARRHRCVCLIGDRLSVVERVIGIRVVL